MPSNPTAQAAILPQEQRAREFLAQGRFRKARDEFKALCKMDRARYLPLLIEANCGLAREMAGKGMNDEARQVLEYLKTLAPTAQVRALEIELGGGKNQAGGGRETILSLMAEPGMPAGERQRLADSAVLTFEAAANGSAGSALGTELDSILGALQAVCQGQYPRALDLIRPLPHSSPFSLWKIFVKGLAAFHSGEMEKAARLLETLPAPSIPGKAARAYLLVAQDRPVKKEVAPPSESVVEMACRLVGSPGAGAPLLRAENAWRNRRLPDMYGILRDGIPQFPSIAPDFIGVLSSFAINVIPTLKEDVKEGFLAYMDRVVRSGPFKSTVELMMLTRSALLMLARLLSDATLIADHERFIKWCDEVYGPNPKRSSFALASLGAILAETFEADSDEDGSRTMRNPEEATRLLEQSLQLDPFNLPASLLLCKLYDELRLKSEKALLLEGMAKRFPDQKEVLLTAGRDCLERLDYDKAITYFQQAMANDRLDPIIPDWLSRALMAQSLDYCRTGRLAKAREAMEEAIGMAVDSPPGAERARWRLKTYQALLEAFFGKKKFFGKAPEAWLDEACAQSPSAAAFLFYAGFAFIQIGLNAGQPNMFAIELAGSVKAEANASDAILLMEIWLREREGMADNEVREMEKVLAKYLKAAAKHPSEPQDATRVVDFALGHEALAGITAFLPAARDFVRRYLKRDPSDPRFRFYEVCLFEGEDDERALNSIIAEATRRKDEVTARRARQRLESKRRPPLPPPEIEDTFDEAIEQALEEGLEEFAVLVEDRFPRASSQLKSKMAMVLALIARMPDSYIEDAKQNPPPGISRKEFAELLDMLYERRKKTAKSATNLPPPPKPRKALPRPPEPQPVPRRPDPNQIDLF